MCLWRELRVKKKKRRCAEKVSIFLENTKTHMYRMLIETVDIKVNSGD